MIGRILAWRRLAVCMAGAVAVMAALSGGVSSAATRNAAAPGVEQPDKFAWLEGQHDPAAVAWAKDHTNQAFAELRAKPVAVAVEQELRDALKSSAPPAQYELSGDRIVRFKRDESHPLGLLQTAPRSADGGVGGTWRTVLDVGALDEKEGKNYQLPGMEFRTMCLPPAFERCLVPLSPGASEYKEFREFDLARGAFVEDGFRVPLNRTRVVWLDANTLLIAVPDNLDGKPVLRSHLPGVVRLWKRGTPFAQSKIIFQALPDDSSVHVRAVGMGGERRGVVMQGKDYLTFVQYLVGPQGNLIPTNLPTRLKSFALTTPTSRHLVMQLAEAATVQGKTYPAESVLAYDTGAGISDSRRVSLVISPPPGTHLNDPIDGLTGGSTHISMVLDHNLTKTLVTAEPGATGWSLHNVMSTPAGVRMVLSSDPLSDDLLVRTEGFLQPVTVSVVRPGKSPVQIEADAPLIDASRYVAEIRSARSKDGTSVDYYLVRPRKPAPGPVPTIIYGYGGFGVNADPNYFGTGLGRTRRSWLMRGGAFVVAAIRGGGERGSAWYAAGRGRNKQNSFDDFAAVARDLVKSGFTVAARIGIHGHSNGGLLTSVEVTEHPELFGAALIGAPVTDVPGFFKGVWGIGGGMAKELGDPNDPAELAGMLRYSPYQNVRAGVKYPRILITTSTEDNQVGAGQARRFAAKLEEVGAHPLLIEGPTGGHPFPSELTNTDVAALQMTFLIDALMK